MSAPRDEMLRGSLAEIASRCPRMIAQCYWAGTSAISLEELGHRESFDLDFHTREAFTDTRPLLAELEQAFPGRVEVLETPDAFGSGFTGLLELTEEDKVTIQVFAGFESVPEEDLVLSTIAPPMMRVALHRYLSDKVQCIVERLEARDLIDIASVLKRRPKMQGSLMRAVAAQDALLLVERLLGWTDEAIRDDLAAHSDVDPNDAVEMRDQLLALVRAEGGR